MPAAAFRKVRRHSAAKALFILIRFSDDCRLVVIIVLAVVLLLVVFVVIIGVSRRHHVANKIQPIPIDLGDGRGHVGLH
jgi:hypothetical protein